MRVGLDVSAVPQKVAGAGRYIVELARRLPGAGVETTLLTRRDDESRWRDVAPGSTRYAQVPNRRVARLAYEAWRLGTSRVVRDVDVWHAPHYSMPHRGSTPTVVTVHDLTFFSHPQWHERSKVAFFRRAITYSAAHAKVLVCVSEFTARELDTYVPEHAPVVVAPLGVDLALFSNIPVDDEAVLTSHDLSARTPFVLFVGTVEPRKGLDVLLEAFKEVAASDPAIELWIAGQAGWAMNDFADQLRRHPGASRIRRLGFVDEALLPVLLRTARVVAYPSRGEGFGLPVLEALACGAVVVTTRDTVMAEIAGDAAQLVEAGNSHSLATAIIASLDIGATDRKMTARRARTRAEEFSWSRTIQQHLVAYDTARGD